MNKLSKLDLASSAILELNPYQNVSWYVIGSRTLLLGAIPPIYPENQECTQESVEQGPIRRQLSCTGKAAIDVLIKFIIFLVIGDNYIKYKHV